jgi:hypothetical protein
MRKVVGARRLVTVALAAVVLVGCQIQLGSPGNTLGNDPTRAGAQPGYWASINGPYSNYADGDPFATQCAGNAASGTTCDSSGANSHYDPNGYLYAVAISQQQIGATVTVSIYDAGFDNGDAAGDTEAATPQNPGFTTTYRLFQTSGDPNNLDTSPSNGMDALGKCTDGTPGVQAVAPGAATAGVWTPICTFVPTQAGIYPLQVTTGPSGGGVNNYSVRATSSSTAQPQVYGLFQLGTFVPLPVSGTSAQIFLANVGTAWAGHTMVVSIFDPGDGGAGNSFVQLLAPPSGAPGVVASGGTPMPCQYSSPAASSTSTYPSTPDSSSDTCQVQTRISGSSEYNGRWLTLEVSIPSTFSCSGDCWWTLKYSVTAGGVLTDRTTTVVNLSTSS